MLSAIAEKMVAVLTAATPATTATAASTESPAVVASARQGPCGTVLEAGISPALSLVLSAAGVDARAALIARHGAVFTPT